jgi:hypothetical protein
MNHYAKTFFFLGMLICSLSIVTATILYNSFGYSVIEKVVYSLFGFTLAITGIILLTASGVLSQKGNYFLSFICFVGWLVAIGFAITSHIGFMASAQLHSQQNSEQSVANKQRAAELDQQIQANSGALAIDVSKLKSDLTRKQSELDDAKAALAGCPKNYVSVCIRPGQAKVASIQKQIAQIESQLNEVARVEGLQNLRNGLSTSNSVTSLDAMPVHVLFQMLGHYFGVKAQEIMSWFLLISACFLEFLGSFFLLLSRKFNEPDYAMATSYSQFTQPVQNEPTQPAQQAIAKHDNEPVALPTQATWSYPQLSDFTKKA